MGAPHIHFGASIFHVGCSCFSLFLSCFFILPMCVLSIDVFIYVSIAGIFQQTDIYYLHAY